MQTADTDRFVALETRLTRAETRLRTLSICATLGVVAAFTIGFHKESIAQGYTMTLAQAAARITALESKVTVAEGKISVVEGKTASISTLNDPNGNPVVRFSNVNVQIVNGSGETSGTPNGRGNLVIGYNEAFNAFGDERTGSHNLVLGARHDYTSYGGIVGGFGNRITAPFACVLSGSNSEATGFQSVVITGIFNRATGQTATVISGGNNTASGFDSCVTGGSTNTASGSSSVVSGGTNRTAPNRFNWVGGGLLQSN